MPLSGAEIPDVPTDLNIPDIQTDGYFTLSYVWGTPDVYKDIIIDDQIVQVGENLYEALRALREIPEFQLGTPVWIDALCINQNDIEERNNEVKIMSEIYNKALRVISWLGPQHNENDDAINFLNLLALKDNEFLAKLVDWWYQNPHLLYESPGKDICQLHNRPYWSRVWILQEVFLARHNSVIIYRPRRINLRKLLSCVEFMEIVNKKVGYEEFWMKGKIHIVPALRNLNQALERLARLSSLVMGAIYFKVHGKPPASYEDDLLFMLRTLQENAGSAQTTDIRDIVYGQLALIGPPVPDLIRVDYSDTNKFVDVMVDFSFAVMNATGRLDWMQCAWIPVLEVDDWTSWVPDFRAEHDCHEYRWARQAGDVTKRNTSGLVVDRKTRELRCQSYQFDIIWFVSTSLANDVVMTTLPRSENEVVDWRQIVRSDPDGFHEDTVALRMRKTIWYLNLLQQGSTDVPQPKLHQYGSTDDLRTALKHCLDRIGWTVNETSILEIPWAYNDKIAQGLCNLKPNDRDHAGLQILIRNFRLLHEGFDLWGHQFKDFFTPIYDMADSNLESYREGIKPRDKILVGGKLMTTAAGLLGSTICDVLPGDEVHLLPGCRMPLILRRFGDRYRLVGSGYIYGIMDGEASTGLDQERRSRPLLRPHAPCIVKTHILIFNFVLNWTCP